VRPRLSSLRLSPAREHEIVEELSQHLEDRWRELKAGGASDEDATRLALAEFREGNLLPAARRVVRSVDPSVPLVEPQPMTTLVSDSVAQPRFRSTLLVSFAVLAMLLAVVGIYGVVGFNVEQRAHEISVRIALGAQRRSVFGLILRQESMPVAIGVVVGLTGAIAVGRGMQGLLFNVEPVDPATFIAMPALLAAIALVACVVPTRRGLDVEPANALRAE
jgi:putative ABC transport system permease protein